MEGSTWLCAVARGPGHPSVLGRFAAASRRADLLAVVDRARSWYGAITAGPGPAGCG